MEFELRPGVETNAVAHAPAWGTIHNFHPVPATARWQQHWTEPVSSRVPHTTPLIHTLMTPRFQTECSLGATRKEWRKTISPVLYRKSTCPGAWSFSSRPLQSPQRAWHHLYPQSPARFPLHGAPASHSASAPNPPTQPLPSGGVPGLGNRFQGVAWFRVTPSSVLPNHHPLPTPFFTGAESPRTVQSQSLKEFHRPLHCISFHFTGEETRRQWSYVTCPPLACPSFC